MALNQPPINELARKAENRYTLVIEAAKRARELVGGAEPLIDPKGRKPVTIAVEEINRGLLTLRRNEEEEE